MAFVMPKFGGPTQANPAEQKRRSAAANAAARAATPESPSEPPGAFTFDGLEPDMCRWPIGDPAQDLTFCGAPRLGLAPYCKAHRKASRAPPGVTARVDAMLEVPSLWKGRP